MTANQVLYALIRHLESKANGDQFTYIPEFTTPENRRLDLLVVANWQSHGYARTAYEIKVSRSDFLSELKDGSKTDAMLSAADAAYFVIPKGLVKVDEIPVGCGLIEVTAQGCSYTKKAPKNDARPNESKHFFMTMMVQAQRRSKTVQTILATGGDSELTPQVLEREKNKAHDLGYAKGQEAERKRKHHQDTSERDHLRGICRQAIGSAYHSFTPLSKDELDQLLQLKDRSPEAINNLRRKIHHDLKTLLVRYPEVEG